MANLLRQTLQNFLEYPRGVLLHDWDTDGVASAAMIMDYFDEAGSRTKLFNYTPPIGNYFLSKSDIDWMKKKKPDFVIVLDMSLEKKDVVMLKSACPQILIVDHHYQSLHKGVVHVNPVAEGVPTRSVPSTTWIINRALWPKVVKPLGALGMVGDQQEDIIKFKRFFPNVSRIAREQKCHFDDLLVATRRLHAVYVTNHRAEVMRLPAVLRRCQNQLKSVRSIPKYKQFQKSIAREVGRLLMKKPVFEDAQYMSFSMKSKYHLIVEMTRRHAHANPRKVIIMSMPHPDNPGMSGVYFRTKRRDLDMSYFVRAARRAGYNAGGRSEVAGMMIPTKEVSAFVKWAVLKLLK